MSVLIGSAAVDVALGRSSLGRPCSDIDMVMSSAELKQFIASARESNTLVTEESRHDGLKHSVVVSSESPLQSNTSFDIELAEMNDGSSSGSLLQMAIAAQQQKQDWVRVSLPQGVPVGDKEYSGLFAYVAPLLVLRAIKRAHLFAPVHWRKHIQDYHILKAATDSKPADASAIGVSAQELEDFQRLRFTEGVQRYGDSRVNLQQTNEQFFPVWYLKEMIAPNLLEQGLHPGCEIYTHDELHELVKYHEIPIFQTLKRDTARAMLNRDLFELLSHEDQLNLVREEVMAICLERLVIPQLLKGKVPNQQACYEVALSMVLTALSKGWFRDFGIEHYPGRAVIQICCKH